MKGNESIHIFKRIINNPTFLFCYYVAICLSPSIYFTIDQPLNLWGKVVVLLFPLGIYFLLFSLVKNTGKWFLFLFPLIVINATQIVLFYLFGEADVVASDMFINMVTTSQSEIGEILGSLIFSLITVCLLYIPPIVLAVRQQYHKTYLTKQRKKTFLKIGVILVCFAFMISFFGKERNGKKICFENDVYPINAFYNLGFAVHKLYRIHKYPETSKNFSFHATRADTGSQRMIIVLVIGETGRADDWRLYGYKRNTNPDLGKLNHLILFSDAVTQNNATHKSVPIILSSNNASIFNRIYYRKSILAAFNEVGFTTIYLSNQVENHDSFIGHFCKQADVFVDTRTEHPDSNPYDGQLIPLMKKMIKTHKGNLFIVLHSYGSHFKYSDRYPKQFRKFVPDDITRITESQRNRLVNAYDNSILYTDYFLSQTISVLKNLNVPTFLLYSSDHGEDIYDDKRDKFLHASPYPTYYQLHIPFFIWYSNAYDNSFPKKITAAERNKNKPVTTGDIFHTLLNSAEINSPYLKLGMSLVSSDFKIRTRMYLNDHDEAIPYQKMNLGWEDFIQIKKHKMAK